MLLLSVIVVRQGRLVAAKMGRREVIRISRSACLKQEAAQVVGNKEEKTKTRCQTAKAEAVDQAGQVDERP